MNKFEKDVRKALIDKDMSLKDLSEQIGISQSYIYDIFKGYRIGNAYKEKICQVLGLGAYTDAQLQQSTSNP